MYLVLLQLEPVLIMVVVHNAHGNARHRLDARRVRRRWWVGGEKEKLGGPQRNQVHSLLLEIEVLVAITSTQINTIA